MPTIGNIVVPDVLYEDAKAVRQRGGKSFLTRPEPPGSCTNCNGGGWLYLQFVSAGPFPSPANSRGEGDGLGGVSICEGGQWYLVHTRAYACPICCPTKRGGGRRSGGP